MPTDFRGNEYKVGDIILYPRMSGRSCEMQEAIVLEIKEFEDTRWIWNPYYDKNVPPHPVTNPRTLDEKFTNFKVRVQPTRSSRDFYRTGTGAGDNKNDVKAVWISIVENIAKV